MFTGLIMQRSQHVMQPFISFSRDLILDHDLCWAGMQGPSQCASSQYAASSSRDLFSRKAGWRGQLSFADRDAYGLMA
jgi:hypothetical protein